MIPASVLVVAKAPVAGLAKTRLAATVGDAMAADIAAAALLDTLDAVAATPVAARVVALTGDLGMACRGAEIRTRLREFTVIEQRGDDFAARLVNAHADTAAATAGLPVLQIGMDTPQVSPDLLSRCGARLIGADAVLGMASDGGWWVLGVADATAAQCLRDVPMSVPETGALTREALQCGGFDVDLVDELTDVDTADDVATVRAACPPASRFRRITESAGL